MAGAGDIKTRLEEDKRDVADLWSAALEAYRSATKIPLDKLPLPQFRSTDEMITYGNQQMDEFHKFRHNQKKVDKLRGLFKQSMGLIQKGAEQLAAAATPAFPPAGAIMTAFSYMLNACKQVSADYDVVTAFFEDMNSFLQRVTILETRLPKYRAYRNCLMEVFTSILTLCGIATRYILEGRFKKWITNLIRGEDSALGGARKSMDTSIDRLQSATEFAILGNTEELQKMNAELRENQEAQTKLLENVAENQDQMLVMLKLIKANIDGKQHEPDRDHQAAPAAKGSAAGAVGVKNLFLLRIDPMAEYREIKSHLIKGTGAWLWQEPAWQAFTERKTRFLTISGPPGAGRSSLSVMVYDKLRESAAREPGFRTSSACFFFRENNLDLINIYLFVQWLIIQIAEQDTDLCEVILGNLNRDDWNYYYAPPKDLWRTVVTPLFEDGTKYRFQMVLDGIDELTEYSRNQLLELLADIGGSNLNIDVVCTVRSAVLDSLNDLKAQNITLDKQKQLPDIEALIQNRLNTGSRLRKFSTRSKSKIETTLAEQAQNISFADNMLRRYNMIGREGAVLKDMVSQMPDSLESIYQANVSEIERRIPPHQFQKYRVLVDWLAFSFKPPTLDMLKTLQRLIPLDTPHGIEDDLYEKFGRVIYLNDSSTTVKQAGSSDLAKHLSELHVGEEADDHDDDLLEVRFRERSFRDFLRKSDVVDGLKTPYAVAQARLLDMCARVLCDNESSVDAASDKGLRDYAGRKWMNHFARSDYAKVSPEERVMVTEAIAKIMMNKNNVAQFFEGLGTGYNLILGTWTNGPTVNGTIAKWLQDTLQEHGPLLGDPNVRSWLAEVGGDPRKLWTRLAKAHVHNWFNAKDYDEARRAFRLAWAAFAKSDVCPFTEDEMLGWKRFEESTCALRDAFDIPLDANAHAMVASIFKAEGLSKAALSETQSVVALSNEAAPRFEILLLTASCQLELKQNEDAQRSILSALDIGAKNSVASKSFQEALALQGQIEFALGKLDPAIETYERCRLYAPDEVTSPKVLLALLKAYMAKEDHNGFVSAFKQWSLTDRIVLLTALASDPYENVEIISLQASFQRSLIKAGAEQYLISTLEEVIKYLDRLDSGAPLRSTLAAIRRVTDEDSHAAKALLNEILDSEYPPSGYALTEADPAMLLFTTIGRMHDLIYEDFRATHDPKIKETLLEELQQLPQRKLALAYPQPRSNINHFALTNAKLLRKMGPSRDYETVVRGAFSLCYEALTDTVGFNDGDNLQDMAILLADIPRFQQEARILFSAMFSRLDPDVAEDTYGESDGEDEEDEDNGEDGEDDSDGQNSNKNDGDVATGVKYYCDGDCEPTKTVKRWNGTTWYACLICSVSLLCEECYQKRQAYNRGHPREPWTKYCGQDHRYIKGPMDGWRGITQGMVHIDGQEPFVFMEWLKELKEVKWEKFWMDFWLNDNVGPSLL